MATWTEITENYRYDSEKTKDSELYSEKNAVIAFSELCVQEGGKKSAISDEVIYIDQVAKNKKTSQLPSTMDFLCGIGKLKKDHKNNKIFLSAPRYFLLGEFRFNYKNPYNIKASDISDKISGTRSLLSEDLSNIYQKCVFLFSDSCIQEARNYFSRLNPGQTWIVITQKEFEFLFDKAVFV